jgi:hypothetical protein
MIRDCPQPPQRRQWPPQQNYSQGRVVDTIEYAPQIRTTTDGRSAQQKAKDWLQGVADEEDNVKDLVMQELWKKEDFPNT